VLLARWRRPRAFWRAHNELQKPVILEDRLECFSVLFALRNLRAQLKGDRTERLAVALHYRDVLVAPAQLLEDVAPSSAWLECRKIIDGEALAERVGLARQCGSFDTLPMRFSTFRRTASGEDNEPAQQQAPSPVSLHGALPGDHGLSGTTRRDTDMPRQDRYACDLNKVRADQPC